MEEFMPIELEDALCLINPCKGTPMREFLLWEDVAGSAYYYSQPGWGQDEIDAALALAHSLYLRVRKAQR